jgi:hypothetical protein
LCIIASEACSKFPDNVIIPRAKSVIINLRILKDFEVDYSLPIQFKKIFYDNHKKKEKFTPEYKTQKKYKTSIFSIKQKKPHIAVWLSCILVFYYL